VGGPNLTIVSEKSLTFIGGAVNCLWGMKLEIMLDDCLVGINMTVGYAKGNFYYMSASQFCDKLDFDIKTKGQFYTEAHASVI